MAQRPICVRYPELTILHYKLDPGEVISITSKGPPQSFRSFKIGGRRGPVINETTGETFSGTWDTDEPEILYSGGYPPGKYTMTADPVEGLEYLCLLRTNPVAPAMVHLAIVGDGVVPAGHAAIIAKGSITANGVTVEFKGRLAPSDVDQPVSGTADLLLIPTA